MLPHLILTIIFRLLPQTQYIQLKIVKRLVVTVILMTLLMEGYCHREYAPT